MSGRAHCATPTQRQEFFNQANARMLRWVDSHTNFILLNAGRSGNDAAEHFRKNNIRVMSGIPSMKDYVRVSLGTPEQMKEFLARLGPHACPLNAHVSGKEN